LPSLDPDLLRWAVRADAPGAEVAEVVAGRPVVLVEQVPGSSAIPAERPPDRLRTLGRVAAALHAVALPPGPALPRRDRPIAGEDIAALRRQGPPRPLLLEAEERVAAPPAGAPEVAHWDVVAALSTPPDMGWFPGAIAGQGRPDLTRELLLRRRDAFLRAALDRLDAGGRPDTKI
jgi:hypothetical protein